MAKKSTFTLNQAKAVRLDLYDASGRHIRTLLNASIGAGRHVEVVDVSNLASGTYYYRLKTNDFEDGGKLVILR